jgi:CheY-like chemotaxis protein
MDHMMPELDGIETTHIIRRFHKEYDDVPIIALTANAVDGVKGLFLQEGMNDFIAKPIEPKILLVKVKKWLPPEKIKPIAASEQQSLEPAATTELTIGDLDTSEAVRRLGSERLYWSVLKDYYRVIDKKAAYIEELMQAQNWSAYTIEVHALKSASKQIGANSLSQKAAAMEAAGNAQDVERIRACTDDMLLQYRSYLSILKPYFEVDSKTQTKEVQADELSSLFTSMRDALENLDIDHMESVIEQMNEYHYENWQKTLFDQLKDAVADVDVERCDAILNEWESRENG